MIVRMRPVISMLLSMGTQRQDAIFARSGDLYITLHTYQLDRDKRSWYGARLRSLHGERGEGRAGRY